MMKTTQVKTPIWDLSKLCAVFFTFLACNFQDASYRSKFILLCALPVCCRWVVLDTETRDLVSVHTDGNEIISTVKYSPGRVRDHVSVSIPCTVPGAQLATHTGGQMV